jgi:hypothetical protein
LLNVEQLDESVVMTRSTPFLSMKVMKKAEAELKDFLQKKNPS